MKSKTDILRKAFQYGAAGMVTFWVYSYLIGRHISPDTATFYKTILGIVMFGAFVNIFISKRWWRRVVWALVFTIFTAVLYVLDWLGYE